MQSSLSLTSLLCFTTWMNLVQAISGAVNNCPCVVVSKTQVEHFKIKEYTIQKEGVCPFKAIVFQTVAGITICKDPDNEWANFVILQLKKRQTTTTSAPGPQLQATPTTTSSPTTLPESEPTSTPTTAPGSKPTSIRTNINTNIRTRIRTRITPTVNTNISTTNTRIKTTFNPNIINTSNSTIKPNIITQIRTNINTNISSINHNLHFLSNTCLSTINNKNFKPLFLFFNICKINSKSNISINISSKQHCWCFWYQVSKSPYTSKIHKKRKNIHTKAFNNKETKQEENEGMAEKKYKEINVIIVSKFVLRNITCILKCSGFQCFAALV
ncbi:hypothetical protein ILYODFUR_026690 [Ilyodon furcidens]|uniref:Chemokine interleukin-8-like domain-containing protein n=1 Tax=Ilyodon furcidens TaxID=33524 RepID=A0ABV0V6D1_9TELE